MMMMMMMMMIRFTLSSRRAQPLHRLKTNGEEDKDHQRRQQNESWCDIYTHTHNYMSFLNRKPCRRVVVLALVLVVIPLSGRMFYVNKLDWFARRRMMMMMMMSSSDGVRARATAREEEVIEEQQRGKMVAKQQHPREEEEEEEEEKRPKPLEAPTT